MPRALDARPASGPHSSCYAVGCLPATTLAHLPALEPCTDTQTVSSVQVYSPKSPDTQRLCRSSRCREVELDSKSSKAAVRSGYGWRKPQGRRTWTETKGVACRERAVKVINCFRTSCRACRLQSGLALSTLVGLRHTQHTYHAVEAGIARKCVRWMARTVVTTTQTAARLDRPVSSSVLAEGEGRAVSRRRGRRSIQRTMSKRERA